MSAGGTAAELDRLERVAESILRERATAKRVVEKWLREKLVRAERGDADHGREAIFPRLLAHLDVDEALFDRWSKLP